MEITPNSVIGTAVEGLKKAQDQIEQSAQNIAEESTAKIMWTVNAALLPATLMSVYFFGLPAVLENDANAAAYGEFWVGSGRSFQSLVLLTLGTGVGCGIIIGDVIVEGRSVVTANRKELTAIREAFGLVFQGAALLNSLTVIENVPMAPPKVAGSFE